MLTDYPSLQDYNRCSQLKLRLVVTLSALLCYNYYLNDFDYLSCYLLPLPQHHKPAQELVPYEYNIEHIIFEVTEAILERTAGNAPGEQLNRVAIHGRGAAFSDETCAIAAGYLIARHLMTYDQALGELSKAYQKHKQVKEAVRVSPFYAGQLKTLETRVLGASRPDYREKQSKEGFRAYQVGNNRCHPNYALITRHVWMGICRLDR